MNKKRIISAIVLIPIVVFALIYGNKYVVDVAFSLIAILGLREFFKSMKDIAKPIEWIGYMVCLMIALIHVIEEMYLITFFLMLVPMLIFILFIHIILTNMKTNFKDIAVTLFGICYVVGFMIFIPLLYGSENGKILIWYILLSAWGTDTLAYSVGRRIGKHKFTDVSPNKSIEGCLAGIFGGIIFIVIYTFFVNTYTNLNISYLSIIPIGIILSFCGQMGDLAASSVKRFAKIKDFGNLIPGHGGVLDRLDSIIFMAPIAYILLTLI